MGKNVVVIGTQWGDEGKGKVVDLLTERADAVVRFQGGHNAGHTLVIEGNRGKDKPQLTEAGRAQLQRTYQAGMTAKEAIAQVAGETGLSRRELYRTWVRMVG